MDTASQGPLGISELCSPLIVPPLSEEFVLLMSISDGICATDLSEESVRHQSLPEFGGRQVLYHMGFRTNMARSLPANANKSRSLLKRRIHL